MWRLSSSRAERIQPRGARYRRSETMSAGSNRTNVLCVRIINTVDLVESKEHLKPLQQPAESGSTIIITVAWRLSASFNPFEALSKFYLGSTG